MTVRGWVSRALIGCSLVASNAALAQVALDEDCTVSVLNRSARVQADGTWRVDNVPSNFGPVRARVNCARNGTTERGYSEPVVLEEGVSTGFANVFTSVQATPVPERLRVTAPSVTLITAGETTQLLVEAVLPGGSEVDVTLASEVQYRSTNDSIATVSPDGLVTAVASGRSLISVLYQGALGILALDVVVGGDADGDGIPDDLELANGLNPSDPLDGIEDPDGDGLDNRAELVDFGTDILLADSDGDGLSDGEEVVAGEDGFQTNPLLADTDGDGFRDELEFTLGTDPTDALSFDLAAGLQSLAIVPSSFSVVVNTVVAEASFLLQVEGTLLDGFQIDLTSTALGTSYASDDLLVCNFGTQDGRVFASQNGACTITAMNSGFSAQSSGTVTSFAPTPLSQLSLPGYANNVDVNGDTAYVAAGDAGLLILDVGDRAAPSIVGTLPTAGAAYDVKASGEIAVVAVADAGLEFVDVGAQAAPVLIGGVDTPGDARDVAVRGSLAAVADGNAGLAVVDWSDPSAPILVASAALSGDAEGVSFSDDGTLAVVVGGATAWVVDLSDVSSPAVLGSVGGLGNARDVVVLGDEAIVADRASGMTLVDISIPSAPAVVATVPPATGGLLTDVAISGSLALGADIFFVNGVPIVNVENPASPLSVGTIDFSGFSDDNGLGLAADARFAYLTAVSGAALENQGSGTTALYIGQYLSGDSGGLPPTLTVVSPSVGEQVVRGSTLVVRVSAVDDVGVDEVRVFVDGALEATDSTLPYVLSVPAPAVGTEVVINVEAEDLAGNQSSEQLTLPLVDDPLATITGRVVDSGGSGVAGAVLTTIGGAFGVSDANGFFTVSGVPTIFGDVQLRVSGILGGRPVSGLSLPTTPILNGSVDIGDIVAPEVPLFEGLYVENGQSTLSSEILVDLNQDGFADLVTTTEPAPGCASQCGVFVRLGTGGGKFGPASFHTVGHGPVGLGAGNMNGDAFPDLVTAGDGVTVLLGVGDGTFGPEVYTARSQPAQVGQVGIADFSLDDVLDVVTADLGGSNVTLYQGNGDGTFGTVVTQPVGASSLVRFSVGDVSGNGQPDFVSTHISNVLRIKSGPTLFSSRFLSLPNVATEVKVADLDGDGAGEVVAGTASDDLIVVPALGNFVFGSPVQYPVAGNVDAIDSADLDGDGNVDVVANPSADPRGVSVFFGLGDGTLEPEARFPAAATARNGWGLGDVNGDGSVDLRINQAGPILINQGQRDLGVPDALAIAPGLAELTVDDVSGDGLDDISVRDGSGFSVFLASPSGVFTKVGVGSTGLSSPVAFGDFDGQGGVDAVSSVDLRLGNADGTFGSPVATFAPSTSAGAVRVADLNGDGFLDVSYAHGSPQDQLRVILGNGDGTFGVESDTALGAPIEDLRIADVDGDGEFDLVARRTNDQIAVLIGHGDGTFQAEVLSSGIPNATAFDVSDLDGDSAADIVVVDANRIGSQGGDVAVLFSLGNGTFGPPTLVDSTLATNPSSRSVVSIGDINSDGLVDFAVGDDRMARVFLATSPGVYEQERFAIAGAPLVNLSLGDINGDGKSDIVSTNLVSGAEPFPSGLCVNAQRLADVDGDGLSDQDEVVLHGTNPSDPDSDGGGRTDGEEVISDGTDPLDAGDDLP
ncbi:MAG: FG-GAP-like repeat-containing protein [Myxococcota bacterium]